MPTKKLDCLVSKLGLSQLQAKRVGIFALLPFKVVDECASPTSSEDLLNRYATGVSVNGCDIIGQNSQRIQR